VEGDVSKTTLSVRDYVAADCDATIAIFLAAIREVASRDYTPDEIEAWAQVEDRNAWATRRASRPTFVAECEGVPIGFSDLEADGHLDMMFVHPACQGVGAATLLLAKVEEEARKQHLDRLFTEASLTARPFFERRGFTVIARQSVEKRGQRLTNVRMEKYL
jgi:putative acetyltransferase